MAAWPYRTRHWTDYTRPAILARDGHRCTAPGPRHSRILDIDHIEPVTKRPDLAFDPTNLITLCRLHHNRKTHSPRRRRQRNSRRW